MSDLKSFYGKLHEMKRSGPDDFTIGSRSFHNKFFLLKNPAQSRILKTVENAKEKQELALFLYRAVSYNTQGHPDVEIL